MDLALNNLQRLICHKTEPTNQTDINSVFIKIRENISNKKCYVVVSKPKHIHTHTHTCTHTHSHTYIHTYAYTHTKLN